MENKTAVEWLEEKLWKLDDQNYTLPQSLVEQIEQAKAMEKEQHQISFDKGYDRRNYIHDFEYGGVEYWEEEPKEFEDYYNETYGK
jgi:hypothetical protein